MISEKTVELNLTTELINYAWWATSKVHFAIAPSQRMEAKLGYDAKIMSNGVGVFIQYKRAYVNGAEWIWHLNRTAKADQHQRLQNLEMQGNAVFYAFPFFYLPNEIKKYRRRLLSRTFWYRPSRIKPSGGSTGHHDVHFNSTTNRWWVSSDEETELPPPENYDTIFQNLENEEHSINKLITDFNEIVLQRDDEDNRIDDLVLSNSILATYHDKFAP